MPHSVTKHSTLLYFLIFYEVISVIFIYWLWTRDKHLS